MVRRRYSEDDRQRMGHAGMVYSCRIVSYVLGCGKSTVARYTRAVSDPLPVTHVPRIGRPHRITQEELALIDTILTANRCVKAINILSLSPQGSRSSHLPLYSEADREEIGHKALRGCAEALCG